MERPDRAVPGLTEPLEPRARPGRDAVERRTARDRCEPPPVRCERSAGDPTGDWGWLNGPSRAVPALGERSYRERIRGRVIRTNGGAGRGGSARHACEQVAVGTARD